VEYSFIWFALGELLIVVFMIGLIARLKGGTHATRHLYFGSVVLTSLALVFMLSMAMYFFASTEQAARAKEIFNACNQIIPPMLTLVIGFYFGKKSEAETADK
jgi:ABC-type dipeptide/oligopeptide/nickel transport system permease component